MDLSTIRFIIWLISHLFNTSGFIDLMGVYREFKRTTYEEIDYISEAANAKRFKEMFKDNPYIYIPGVYEEYTSRRVLVLEWIDGIKINDYAALDAAGVDRLKAAKRTVRAYFYQFLEVGFFHADPHPGNILVKKGSPRKDPVVAFVDFGMVGSVTKSMQRALRDLFLSFVARDSRSMVGALSRLGFIGPGANIPALERGLGLMLEQYYAMSLGEVRDLDISEVTEDIRHLVYGEPFMIPANFAFIGRAVSTLVGVSTGLAPDFRFLDVATPYARKFFGLDTTSIEQNVEQLFAQLLEAGRILLKMPRALEQVINKLDAGQLEVKAHLGMPEGKSKQHNVTDLSGGTSGISSFAVIVVFVISIAGGILLENAHHMISSWFCFGLAAITALRLLFRR